MTEQAEQKVWAFPKERHDYDVQVQYTVRDGVSVGLRDIMDLETQQIIGVPVEDLVIFTGEKVSVN